VATATTRRPSRCKSEIEDVGALIEAAGREATVYGHSLGAALVLRAAAHRAEPRACTRLGGHLNR
jgi:pimeloyl-ACP methyl ester carboxylesterase